MKTNVFAEQMRRFGEGNLGQPAVYQPGEYIDLTIVDGACVVVVDCWSWMADRGLISDEFDVDAWDELKLILTQAEGVPARQFWTEAFQIARAMVNGLGVEIGGGAAFTIESHVAAVRTRPVIKIGQPDGLVGEAAIAEALGCTIDEVRARASREGWACWLESEAGQPMVYVEPKKTH